MDYDFLIIGTERPGIERAISAAQMGYRAVVIDVPGNAPTLELMRRAASLILERGNISIQAWREEVVQLASYQTLVDETEMESAGVELFTGPARFVDATSVQVIDGMRVRNLSARKIIVATGLKSWCPHSFYADEKLVLTIDSLLNLDRIPQSMIIVGAGNTGRSMAMTLALLGVEVVIVDEDFQLTGLTDMLAADPSLRTLSIAYRLGEEVIGTEVRPNKTAAVRLASGRVLSADAVLLCLGFEGRTAGLKAETAGIGLDERGRIWCDQAGNSWAPNISVVGKLMSYMRKADKRDLNTKRGGSLPSHHLSTAAERVQVSVRRDRP